MAKGKQLRRRSHLALKKQALIACAQCKKMIQPHRACQYCGSYKGRMVVDVTGKALKKAQKRKDSAAAAK
jgi:large subunit ribosomal protein L32